MHRQDLRHHQGSPVDRGEHLVAHAGHRRAAAPRRSRRPARSPCGSGNNGSSLPCTTSVAQPRSAIDAVHPRPMPTAAQHAVEGAGVGRRRSRASPDRAVAGSRAFAMRAATERPGVRLAGASTRYATTACSWCADQLRGGLEVGVVAVRASRSRARRRSSWRACELGKAQLGARLRRQAADPVRLPGARPPAESPPPIESPTRWAAGRSSASRRPHDVEGQVHGGVRRSTGRPAGRTAGVAVVVAHDVGARPRPAARTARPATSPSRRSPRRSAAPPGRWARRTRPRRARPRHPPRSSTQPCRADCLGSWNSSAETTRS